MSKIMKFADGAKEVEVGMQVVYSNGQSGRHHHMLNESTVEKIGNKLVTLKDGSKFYLEDGTKQTEYTSGRLYSSKEEYDLSVKRAELIHTVERRVKDYSFHMTYDQAIKIAKIIGLEIKE